MKSIIYYLLVTNIVFIGSVFLPGCGSADPFTRDEAIVFQRLLQHKTTNNKPEKRSVRGSHLAAMISGDTVPQQLDGKRDKIIQGLIIQNSFQLRAREYTHSILFKDCVFQGDININGDFAKNLLFKNCVFQGTVEFATTKIANVFRIEKSVFKKQLTLFYVTSGAFVSLKENSFQDLEISFLTPSLLSLYGNKIQGHFLGYNITAKDRIVLNNNTIEKNFGLHHFDTPSFSCQENNLHGNAAISIGAVHEDMFLSQSTYKKLSINSVTAKSFILEKVTCLNLFSFQYSEAFRYFCMLNCTLGEESYIGHSKAGNATISDITAPGTFTIESFSVDHRLALSKLNLPKNWTFSANSFDSFLINRSDETDSLIPFLEKTSFSLGTYKTFIEYFNRQGNRDKASAVSKAMKTRLAEGTTGFKSLRIQASNFLKRPFDITITLLVIFLLGFWAFRKKHMESQKEIKVFNYSTFGSPILYTLDILLPVISLDIASEWKLKPDKRYRKLCYLVIKVVGYVAALVLLDTMVTTFYT